jgi:riboflavin synthase
VFTGIIEERGTVKANGPLGEGVRLEVWTKICGPDLSLGDSLAVNGCCLTVVEKKPEGEGVVVGLDLLKETWNRTNLQFHRPGDSVNLERPLRADARLGGHFVTGHIDGLGRVEEWTISGSDRLLRIATPPEILRYVIFKGSIAVDGISLTVTEVSRDGFAVWVIPHTRQVTALGERKAGDAVNLEADLLGKYAEKFVAARLDQTAPASGSQGKP